MKGIDANLGGYTLLELLAAVAIGMLLLSMCMVVTGDATNRCGGLEDRFAVDRSARVVMNQLSEDLASVVVARGLLLEASSEAWVRDRLGLYCLMPDAGQLDDRCVGDLCAVLYYCEDVAAGGVSERCLMRAVCHSADVFRALADGDDARVWSDALQTAERLVTGVVAFDVVRLVPDGLGGWLHWRDDDDGFPAAVKIKLVLAERKGMRNLSTPADWNGAEWLGLPENAGRHPRLHAYSAKIMLRSDED